MNTFIMHFGIKGQKWGVRNGPPYPLGSGQMSSREKAAGSSPQKQKKKGLSDRQKAVLKFGAKAVATAFIAYGGYKLYQSGALDNLVETGKNEVDSILRKAGDGGVISNGLNNAAVTQQATSVFFNAERAQKISELTGLKVKTAPDTFETNVQKANPGYVGGPGDPLYMNCSHSVISWVMNEIGLDVKALPMEDEFKGSGVTPFEFKRYFKGLDWGEPHRYRFKDDLEKDILSRCNNENAMGVIRAEVPNGHFMGWKVENGKVSFCDPQGGNLNIDRSLRILRAYSDNKEVNIARLDNLDVNPKYLTKAVANAH